MQKLCLRYFFISLPQKNPIKTGLSLYEVALGAFVFSVVFEVCFVYKNKKATDKNRWL